MRSNPSSAVSKFLFAKSNSLFVFNTLKISSICGGVTLLLPLDWNVKV
jgi:hypothetical protein